MRGAHLAGQASSHLAAVIRRRSHTADNVIDDRIEFQDPVVVRAYRGWMAPIVRLRRRSDDGHIAA